MVLRRGGDRHLPRQGRGRHRDRGSDRRRPPARTPDPPRTPACSSPAGRRRPGMAGDTGGARSFGARPQRLVPDPAECRPLSRPGRIRRKGCGRLLRPQAGDHRLPGHPRHPARAGSLAGAGDLGRVGQRQVLTVARRLDPAPAPETRLGRDQPVRGRPRAGAQPAGPAGRGACRAWHTGKRARPCKTAGQFDGSCSGPG